MTETKPDDSSISLFLQHQKDINRIRDEVTELIKQDLEVGHKMDLVMQQQSALKERFEHSSATGHKTWEATQRIEANIEKLTTRVILAENTALEARKYSENFAEEANKSNEKIEKKFDKYILGIVVTVFCSILVTIMTLLLKWKP